MPVDSLDFPCNSYTHSVYYRLQMELRKKKIVKMLLFLLEEAHEEGRHQLLQEIELMKKIGSHRNVLSMLGYWVRTEPIMLILEYVPHGDLLQWLRNKRLQVRIY